MTANIEALLPGAVVLLDADSAHLGFARGDRATVIKVEQDRHVTCLLDRTGQRLAFSPDELILVPDEPIADAGHITTALALLLCIFGALLFLAVYAAGQHGMCRLHHDQLRYCPGYSAGEGTAR